MAGQKRLHKELAALTKQPKDWCTVELCNNINTWIAYIKGPSETPWYSKGIFKLKFEITIEYPFKNPKVKFLTKIYHPNVKKNGETCHPMLRPNGWSPQLKIIDVIIAMRQRFIEPELENPLEPDIAKEYQQDFAKFKKNSSTMDF